MHSCIKCGCKLTKRYYNFYCAYCKDRTKIGNVVNGYSMGLTSFVNGKYGQRCLKCDYLLANSTWKGVLVVHRNTYKQMATFYCITCIRNPKMKCHKTDEQLNGFVANRKMIEVTV